MFNKNNSSNSTVLSCPRCFKTIIFAYKVILLGIKLILQTNDEENSEFGELTDEEEFIKANLEGENPLPLDIMENIIFPWWFQEPYQSV